MSAPLSSDDVSFQTLADRAPVMIWMSGLDMGCFYFNRAWLEYRGRLLAQEYGNGWAEGVHPDDLKACVAHYVRCFEEHAPFAMNYRLQDATGEYRWILDRGAPHHALDGTFLGFFGGCAETDAQSPATLNTRLRIDLAGVADFARDLALARLQFPPEAPAAGVHLKSFIQNLSPAQASRAHEVKHVVGQMEKLATDMLAYGKIPHGACLK